VGVPPLDAVLERQAVLHSLAGGAGSGPQSAVGLTGWVVGAVGGGGPASSAEMERTALERMRVSVNNLSDFNLGAALAGTGAWRLGGGGSAGLAAGLDAGSGSMDEGFDAADEAEAEVAAYWARQERERHRVAIQPRGSGALEGAPDSARAVQLLPADPFDQEGGWLRGCCAWTLVAVCNACWCMRLNARLSRGLTWLHGLKP
jgi:hypothetical protein